MTIQEPLLLSVKSRRDKRSYEFKLVWDEDGWIIEQLSNKKDRTPSKPNGDPDLYQAFKDKMIYHPWELREFLELLWSGLNGDEINKEQAQSRLDELAAWIDATTDAVPKDNFWRDATGPY